MKRKFFPGSEWLYAKVYLPVNLADDILSNLLKDCIYLLQNLKYIDKCFFIRYTDPSFHLRIRLHLKSIEYSGTVAQILLSSINKYIDTHFIWRVCFDTYVRELERYGSAKIELCESFFSHDSLNTINILSKIEADDNEMRWKIAFSKIDIILCNIFKDISSRYSFINRFSKSYLKEFQHFEEHYDLDRMYRVRKSVLTKLTENFLKENKAIKEWNEFCSNGNIGWILSDETGESRLQSIIHMLVNRIIPVEPRKYEMILYFFLERQYLAKLHKQNLK